MKKIIAAITITLDGFIGSGLQLLKNINHRINLSLVKTKTFGCGAITLCYDQMNK